MKKLSYFAIIVCTVCLFVLPGSGLAKMTKMTDSELEQTTAQVGFSHILEVFEINHDEETGSYYFGSDDDGYISLADVSYDTSNGFHTAITSTTITDNGTAGVDYEMDGNIMETSNFSSTIRIGSEIGTGDSLGTLHIGHMVLNAHGTVRVTFE